MEILAADERRANDNRITRLEDRYNDHDKAITTLVSNHQVVSYTLTEIQKTLAEISQTLKKQVEIEKQIVKYDIVEKDYGSRITSLEKAHNGDGCSVAKAQAERVRLLENATEKQWTHIEKIEEKVTKIWIYGSIAIFVVSALFKFGLEHLFK